MIDSSLLSPVPDLAIVRRWLDADNPIQVVDEIEHALTTRKPSIVSMIPAVAWPLIEAVRRSGRTVLKPITLAVAGELLSTWGDRHGLLSDSPSVAGVAAQCLFIQDLHCLADLYTLAGAGDAAPYWSRLGHQVEDRLHRSFWTGTGYNAMTDHPPALACENLLPLLLLDTPSDRVKVLASQALPQAIEAIASGDGVLPWLVCIGLRRHKRNDVADALSRRLADSARR